MRHLLLSLDVRPGGWTRSFVGGHGLKYNVPNVQNVQNEIELIQTLFLLMIVWKPQK